jgi:hypothetical protein
VNLTEAHNARKKNKEKFCQTKKGRSQIADKRSRIRKNEGWLLATRL